MVLGDSLVAGHGLPQDEAFPDILQAELAGAGHDVEVLNAGVSVTPRLVAWRGLTGRSPKTRMP